MSNLPNLPAIIQYDLNDLFVGAFIGSGSFREVYHCWHMPGCVIKLMNQEFESETPGGRGGEFANVTEWQIWNAVKNTRLAKYFAPCVDISPCGQALIMKYAPPIKDWPKKMPNVLDDMRPANLGLYEGKVVAIDYGRHEFFTLAMKHVQMIKPKKKNWRFATVPAK